MYKNKKILNRTLFLFIIDLNFTKSKFFNIHFKIYLFLRISKRCFINLVIFVSDIKRKTKVVRDPIIPKP